ncbi:MAG: extracellular solute-binding protein [Lachnospiraceae bacterium]|nr:extracellular solute-binding protein [Lachnospiraceae bacterium]
MNIWKKILTKRITIVLSAAALLFGLLCSPAVPARAGEPDDSQEPIVLRVSNWEEYIDEGDWDEEETIELPSGDIIGENSAVEDFEEWYFETYGREVRVEYSTFGTNEDLYNMLTLGDEFDLVCPSEYMIMKLMAEQELVPLSDSFFDEEDENNYYIKGVSPYIRSIFETQEIGGEPWSKYAAGYMWGVTGFVYNPEVISEEEASSWKILSDDSYSRQITIKDNVRDSYFAAVGAIKSDLLMSESFRNDPDYKKNLEREMNDTSPEMIAQVQEYLQNVKDNVYSFETDAGKADMITGKVVCNYQWSGDGVYTLDQADEDDFYLAFTVPQESTNIYFDGWVMLKRGIGDDIEKQHAAEAFINFNSRPDIAIRNMYYIGYTSVLSGGEDPRIFEYAEYNYAVEDEEEEVSEEDGEIESAGEDDEETGENAPEDAAEETEETIEYDISYFFGEEDGARVIEAPEDSLHRQLYAAYPPRDVLDRSSVMIYFTQEQNAAINRMWVNVRCFNIRHVPVYAWILILALIACAVFAAVKIRKRFYGVG